MMKNPKVSVIIPVYNMGKYIRECLDTVVAQSLKNIEIICVDDGSTDSSRSIISEYRQRDKRIILLTQENQGAGPARNNGIRHAKGEFIAFMDPDDYYPEKQTLQKMYDAAIKNKVLICGGCFSELHNGEIRTTFDKNGNFWGYTFEKCEKISYKDWQFDYGYHRFLYKRKFLKDNNLYFPPLLRFQDPPFFISAMIKAGEFYALNYPTYVYRVSHKTIVWKKRKIYELAKGLLYNLKISRKYRLNKLHYLTYRRIMSEFKNTLYHHKNIWSVRYLYILYQIYQNIDADLIRNINPYFKNEFKIKNLFYEEAEYKKISDIKILNFMPVINKKQKKKHTSYFLFNLIPLIKISSNSQSSKYYLLGFIPLLKIRNK